MRLICLGSTGYHPNERRHTACFMLPEVGIVLDAGTGAFRIGRFLQTDRLDIFVSHAHLDHVVGLTYLWDVLRDRAGLEVFVHGTAQTLAAVQGSLLDPSIFPARLPCEFRTLTDVVPLAGGGHLKHFPLDHPGGCHGFRLDWPHGSLAYVTDTTASAQASYLPRIQGVDVLIHECYFPDALREQAILTGHSCTSDVAHLALAAGVSSLLLTHVAPYSEEVDPIGLDVAKAVFSNAILGEDLLELPLGDWQAA